MWDTAGWLAGNWVDRRVCAYLFSFKGNKPWYRENPQIPKGVFSIHHFLRCFMWSVRIESANCKTTHTDKTFLCKHVHHFRHTPFAKTFFLNSSRLLKSRVKNLVIQYEISTIMSLGINAISEITSQSIVWHGKQGKAIFQKPCTWKTQVCSILIV